LQAELLRKDAVGNTESIKASSDFARSLTASVAQLGERLASIQLMRDKMYRACEAYGNGAINSTTYTAVMARFDKTMTSLLSSELAAGAFGRELASLGGSASINGPSAEAIKAAENKIYDNISTYKKNSEELAKKQAAANEAKTNLDTAQSEVTKKQSELEKATETEKANKEAALVTAKDAKEKSDTEYKTKQADLKNQKDATDASNKAIDDSIANLAKIVSATANMYTNSTANKLAALSKDTNNSSSAQIVADIHKAYMNDDGIDPLIDSCIASMDYTTPLLAVKNTLIVSEANGEHRNQLVKRLITIQEQISEAHNELADEQKKANSANVDKLNNYIASLEKKYSDTEKKLQNISDRGLSMLNCPCFGPKPSSLDEKRLQPFFLS
jgi:hypothetical protein